MAIYLGTIKVGDVLPIGTIGLLSNSVLPSGWAVCDGSDGTPNLLNLFVKAGATAGATGGSADSINVSHTHTVTAGSLAAHNHNNNAYSTSANGCPDGCDDRGGSYMLSQSTTNTGSSSSGTPSATVVASGVTPTNTNLPAYIQLAYIQRIA